MSFPPPSFQPILTKIANHLTSNKQKISVAETAAGGLISAALLTVPGASAYFAGGATLYTLPSREVYAGWTQEDIQKYNGPTESVVLGLAKNVRGRLGSDWTIGESGTAGPTGGSHPNRTPYDGHLGEFANVSGYVILAIVGPGVEVSKAVHTGLGNDRSANMVEFARLALEYLLEQLEAENKGKI